MFPLFPWLGTILVPSSPASCQQSSSPPPSSGFVVAASFHLSSCSTTALRRSALRTLLLHHLSQVLGQAHRHQPPPGLHGCGSPARQPVSPRQTAKFACRRPSCRNQAGLIFRHADFFTFLFGATPRRSRNRFPTRRGGFCMPGTGGAFTVSTETIPVPSTGTATEIRPLTSSPCSRGQSSGGSPVETCLHHWLTVKPVGCTPVSLYRPLVAPSSTKLNKVLKYILKLKKKPVYFHVFSLFLSQLILYLTES